MEQLIHRINAVYYALNLVEIVFSIVVIVLMALFRDRSKPLFFIARAVVHCRHHSWFECARVCTSYSATAHKYAQ